MHARPVSRWLEKLWSAALYFQDYYSWADYIIQTWSVLWRLARMSTFSPRSYNSIVLKGSLIIIFTNTQPILKTSAITHTPLTSQPLTKWILMTQDCTNKTVVIWKLNSYYCQKTNGLKTWFCSINLSMCF